MVTSGLNTLLAQRLDAVLGTTLAQHPTLLAREGGQALSALLNNQPLTSATDRDRAAADAASSRRQVGADRAGQSERAPGQDAAQAGAAARSSSRIQLSEPARLILALLVNLPPAAAGAQARPGGALMPAQIAARFAAQEAATGSARAGARPAATSGLPVTGAGTAQTDRPGSAATAGQSGARGEPVTPTAARSADTPASALRPAVPGTAAAAASATAAPTTAATPAASLAAQVAGTPVPAGAQVSTQAGVPLAAPAGAGVAGTAATGVIFPGASLLPTLVQGFTQALTQAVGDSGLFYESHLAQVAFGERSLDKLQREPQARLPLPSQDAPAEAARDGGRAASSSPVPGVHPDAVPLVRQQLEALALSTFQWQGEAWPGAEAEWSVTEQGQEAADDAAQWSSRLRLSLPHLGQVDVILTLSGEQLGLRLTAPDSAEGLSAQSGVLRERLHEAGFALTALAIDPGTPQAATAPPERAEHG